MHSATKGQESQFGLLVWSGQQGMSSDMTCMSSDITGMLPPAPDTAMAAAGVASGASRSPDATSSITTALANRFRSMRSLSHAGTEPVNRAAITIWPARRGKAPARG